MKVLKYLAIIFGIIIALGMTTCAVLSKSVPLGVTGPDADKLADKMLEALNKEAWDTTNYAKWTFRGKNHYLWDRTANLAQISWNDYRVLLNPDEVTGVVYKNETKLQGKEADKVFQKAWSNWCNDMFWFVAPFKVNDPGTVRSIVQHEDGERLMISYEDGGVTPGDKYVWILDENAVPTAFEMYVQILPIKGIKANWGGWKELPTGAMVSTEHKSGKLGMSLENVAGGQNLSDIGLTEDVWAEIR